MILPGSVQSNEIQCRGNQCGEGADQGDDGHPIEQIGDCVKNGKHNPISSQLFVVEVSVVTLFHILDRNGDPVGYIDGEEGGDDTQYESIELQISGKAQQVNHI